MNDYFIMLGFLIGSILFIWALFALINMVVFSRFKKACDYFSELHDNIKPEYLDFTADEMNKKQAIYCFLLVLKVCVLWWRPISSFKKDLCKLVGTKGAYDYRS